LTCQLYSNSYRHRSRQPVEPREQRRLRDVHRVQRRHRFGADFCGVDDELHEQRPFPRVLPQDLFDVETEMAEDQEGSRLGDDALRHLERIATARRTRVDSEDTSAETRADSRGSARSTLTAADEWASVNLPEQRQVERPDRRVFLGALERAKNAATYGEK
jgi:hypothetical protein